MFQSPMKFLSMVFLILFKLLQILWFGFIQIFLEFNESPRNQEKSEVLKQINDQQNTQLFIYIYHNHLIFSIQFYKYISDNLINSKKMVQTSRS
ncbi:hypothetical protein pb186bvf_005316 [Paramecium bursaria]